jgi:hypothetical protein
MKTSKISLQQILPLLQSEIQGLLHPAQVNFGFRGSRLSSRPRHSPKVLVLLNPICLLKHVLNCEQNSSFFIFRSRLCDIRINFNRITERLLM